MSHNELEPSSFPPDPLRRFVPTPLRAAFDVEQIRVVVQTNDFSLLPELPLSTLSEADNNRHFKWKIVRDYDAGGILEEPVFLTSDKLTTVVMGPACLVAVDYERCELLGFVGVEVDVPSFKHSLLPLFFSLMIANTAAQSVFLGDQGSSINA